MYTKFPFRGLINQTPLMSKRNSRE